MQHLRLTISFWIAIVTGCRNVCAIKFRVIIIIIRFTWIGFGIPFSLLCEDFILMYGYTYTSIMKNEHQEDIRGQFYSSTSNNSPFNCIILPTVSSSSGIFTSLIVVYSLPSMTYWIGEETKHSAFSGSGVPEVEVVSYWTGKTANLAFWAQKCWK
jgi:hypothetical protein